MKPERHSRILIGYNQFLNGESVASRATFNLSSFEDFNKLIEAVILYDRVVLLGDYALPDGPISRVMKNEQIVDTLTDVALRDIIARPEVTRTFTESIRYAFGEEAVNAEDAQPSNLISNRISPNWFDQFSYNALYEEVVEFGRRDHASIDALRVWLKDHIYATRVNGGHFSYIARSLVYSAVADHAGMDYAPDFLRLPLAAMSFGKCNEAVPKKLYDALCEKLESEIEALVLLGMPVAIFIPPLTARLLDRADSVGRLPAELLALRQEFASIRVSYNAFTALLSDPTVSIHEKISARQRLFQDITGMMERNDVAGSLNLKVLWDKLAGAEAGADGVSSKLSLSGAVSVLLDEFVKSRKMGRARALFDLWTDTVKMKNYGTLIEKAFKTKIDPKEVETLRVYSGAIRKLVGSVCAR